MSSTVHSESSLRTENAELRARLDEAEETLRAIRGGGVDALVIEGVLGPQVFTRQGLQAESNRLRGEFLAQVSDAVIASDNDQCIIYFNAAAERQYGVSASEVLGRRLSEICEYRWPQPDDATVAMTALRERGEWRGENIHITRDGRELRVESSVTVLRDSAGEPAGTLAVIRDVSSRKQAEQGQRDSDERYQTLFNSVSEGFCIIDMVFDADARPVNYRFLEVNPAFAIHTGWHGAQGKLVRDIAPDLEARWFEIFGEIALTGEPMRFLHEVKAMGRFFEVSAVRFGGSESRKVAILFSDITERQRVEAALKAALVVAEKANRAKSEFLSSMSHDLRTPLGAILGFAQLMASDSLPPTPVQKRSIDQILKAGWYLLDLINEILDLSLIESGKLSLSQETVSLAEIMHECQGMIEPQAKKRAIRVTFPRFDVPLSIRGDRTRIKQVLLNLLSNAVKYNKLDGSVSVDCIPSPPGRVRICVTDTGDGLTPQKLRELFQPFNRLGQEMSVAEGTGIGLVVSKRLVEMMGGFIGVESTVGQGSVFWFELNVMDEAHIAANAPLPQAFARAQALAGAPWTPQTGD